MKFTKKIGNKTFILSGVERTKNLARFEANMQRVYKRNARVIPIPKTQQSRGYRYAIFVEAKKMKGGGYTAKTVSKARYVSRPKRRRSR